MEALIHELVQQGLGSLIDKRRDPLVMNDPVYQQLADALIQSEVYFEELELTSEEKTVVEDYLGEHIKIRDRIADLSYMAGVRDAVKLLLEFGILKGTI